MRAFSQLHPAVLMTYFLVVLTVAMFVSNPIIELISLAGAVLFCFVLTSRGEKLRDIKFYIPFLILISITNPLFSHNGQTPLFFMNGNAVTLEAIAYGFGFGLMLVSVMLWCKTLGIVFSSDKLLYLFGTVTPKLSLVGSMTLRWIPMLKRQAVKISRTQRAMGLYTSKSYADRIRSALRVFSALIGWSLENAVEVSRSMKARGYGNGKRTCYSNYKFAKTDLFVLIFIVITTAFVVLAAAFGLLDFAYYPAITKIKTGVMPIMAYAGFGLLAFLPTAVELEENIRWTYCKSKI